ncbi:uncharacterized protein LOC108857880 [Raphanus sativus]|uniref:Uncharacterized protein LOC108857880 n=1 Tax=Raphanus sativus TaxID=3726 RepID=A0A6J0NRU1_RAPSA|nr:uncharacterized protein LOC108857880 [Raphanus sativus]
MWLIWKNRNSILYADTQDSTSRMLQDMKEEVDQWFFLNSTTAGVDSSRTGVAEDDKWQLPEIGVLKCNIHANWRNAFLHSGVAWITRDHEGNVSHHSRDALCHMPNRMVAELQCVLWAMRSLRDLQMTKVTIALDYQEVMEAIISPQKWPGFRNLLEQVEKLKGEFESLTFECVKASSNGIARDIAKSVLRDGRYQSYLALGGPSWLHDRILRENQRSNV